MTSLRNKQATRNVLRHHVIFLSSFSNQGWGSAWWVTDLRTDLGQRSGSLNSWLGASYLMWERWEETVHQPSTHLTLLLIHVLFICELAIVSQGGPFFYIWTALGTDFAGLSLLEVLVSSWEGARIYSLLFLYLSIKEENVYPSPCRRKPVRHSRRAMTVCYVRKKESAGGKWYGADNRRASWGWAWLLSSRAQLLPFPLPRLIQPWFASLSKVWFFNQ